MEVPSISRCDMLERRQTFSTSSTIQATRGPLAKKAVTSTVVVSPARQRGAFVSSSLESSEKRKHNRRRTALFFFSITRTTENYDVGTARESKRRKSDLFAPHTSARFISRVARIILRPRKSVLRHEPVCKTYMNSNHSRITLELARSISGIVTSFYCGF